MSSARTLGDLARSSPGSGPVREPSFEEWTVREAAPSRQATDKTDATYASESDLPSMYMLPLAQPLLPGKKGSFSPPHRPNWGQHCELPPPALSPALGRAHRLEVLREQRGWKYFFRHVAPIPSAFAAGILIGFMTAWFLLPWLIAREVSSAVRKGDGLGTYSEVPPPWDVPEAYFAATPLNNSCLLPNIAMPPASAGKPQTFDACRFIVQSTDEVWNLRTDVDASIEKYFHEGYVDAGSWGKRIVGKKALRDAVLSEMRAFPDIKIHITDCLCGGNDVDGYKCAMPDILTGTNMGPSAYGPATGRQAKWTGLVQSLVKRNPKTGQWQYYAEWGVHDEWSLIQQLGLDFSRVPKPPINSEPLHDCSPLVQHSPDGFGMNQFDAGQQIWHQAEKFPSA